MNKPLLGAHVSAAGGLPNAIRNAQKIGAQTIQIFGSSPRQYAVRIPSPQIVAEYKDALRKSRINPVFLHAPYLITLGSPKSSMRAISIKALSGHLEIAEAIGARGLIFHLGSGDPGKTVAGIKTVLKAISGKTLLLMENSSGGGTKLGSTIDSLAALFAKVKSPRVKLCFDTAHAYESGALSYEDPKTIKKYFDEWDAKIGLHNLDCVHVNDSKTAFGSRADRHENIGQGHIGLRGFVNLAKERRLHDKPWILEVPGMRDEGPDKKNIEMLESCFK